MPRSILRVKSLKVQTRLREFRKCRGLYTLLTRGATKITDNYWITEKNYWQKKNYWFLKFHLESQLGHTHEIPFNPQYILFCILMGVQEPLIKFATEHFFVKSLKVQTRLRKFLKCRALYTLLTSGATKSLCIHMYVCIHTYVYIFFFTYICIHLYVYIWFYCKHFRLKV